MAQRSRPEIKAQLLARCQETFQRYKDLQAASNELARQALDAVQPDGTNGLKKSNELLRQAVDALREHHEAVTEYLAHIKY